MSIERPPTEAAEAIADLWVDLAAEQLDHGSHLRPETNRERIREAAVRHIVTDTLLVARDGDADHAVGDDIVGFVMFSVESGSFEQDATRGIVENLYVVPSARGTGVGSDLLGAAEAALADRGCDAVALEVLAANERARRFYGRQGYAEHRLELEKSLAPGRDADEEPAQTGGDDDRE